MDIEDEQYYSDASDDEYSSTEDEDEDETQWVPEDEWNDKRMEWGMSSGERFDGYTDFLAEYVPPPHVFIAPRVYYDPENLSHQEYTRLIKQYEQQLPQVYNQWRNTLDPQTRKTMPYPKKIHYGYTPDWGWREFTLPLKAPQLPHKVASTAPIAMRGWTTETSTQWKNRIAELPIWDYKTKTFLPQQSIQSSRKRPRQQQQQQQPSLPNGLLMTRPGTLEDACDYYYNHKLSSDEIKSGRFAISQEWLKSDPRRRIDLTHKLTEPDLLELFVLYDRIFFAPQRLCLL